MRSPSQPADSVLAKSTASIHCRLCGGSVRLAVDFGTMPLANAFLRPEQFSSEYFFNLSAGFCETCTLFQLMKQPRPELMFHDAYPFFTGSSERMRQHFADLASLIQRDFIPSGGSIIELGSNDGTLLKNFPRNKYRCLGIDPSSNAAAVAKSQGVETQISFFNLKSAEELRETNGSADIFIAANVLCHIPDLPGSLKGVFHLLSSEGIGIFEDPYLGEVLKKTSYDQIYDEHVYLFSVTALKFAFEQHGLRLFDIQSLWTHGGSIRYFVCKKESKRPETENVRKLMEMEKQSGMLTYPRYLQFREQCEHSRDLLLETLTALKLQGKRVAGYAATSKSTTVLNYCGITPSLVEYISDTTPEKQGKFSPGVHIPIRPYEDFKKDDLSHALLFAWNHTQEIMAKEEQFKKRGGHWVTYVPKVRIS